MTQQLERFLKKCQDHQLGPTQRFTKIRGKVIQYQTCRVCGNLSVGDIIISVGS